MLIEHCAYSVSLINAQRSFSSPRGRRRHVSRSTSQVGRAQALQEVKSICNEAATPCVMMLQGLAVRYQLCLTRRTKSQRTRVSHLSESYLVLRSDIGVLGNMWLGSQTNHSQTEPSSVIYTRTIQYRHGGLKYTTVAVGAILP